MLYYAVLRPMVVEAKRKVERMKSVGVKVTEVTSGHSFVHYAPNLSLAKFYASSVNKGPWPTKSGAILKAVIVK